MGAHLKRIGEPAICNGFWISEYDLEFDTDQGTSTRRECCVCHSGRTSTDPVTRNFTTMSDALAWCNLQPKP